MRYVSPKNMILFLLIIAIVGIMFAGVVNITFIITNPNNPLPDRMLETLMTALWSYSMVAVFYLLRNYFLKKWKDSIDWDFECTCFKNTIIHCFLAATIALSIGATLLIILPILDSELQKQWSAYLLVGLVLLSLAIISYFVRKMLLKKWEGLTTSQVWEKSKKKFMFTINLFLIGLCIYLQFYFPSNEFQRWIIFPLEIIIVILSTLPIYYTYNIVFRPFNK